MSDAYADGADTSAKIKQLEGQILAQKRELADLRRKMTPQEVGEYSFTAHDESKVALAQMFGSQHDLILVHNMGKSCPYCTLWADGFVGLTGHIENRAAFVVVSKDTVDVQREFYRSRDWNFRMYSSYGTSFNRDMGFEDENGRQKPGVSTFRKEDDGSVFRVAFTSFGPGDDFCAAWHLFDLLKEGANDWQPRFTY